MRTAAGFLFVLLLAEICLGGGGRLSAWGPVSLRMIFFSMAIGCTLVFLWLGEKIPKDYKILLLLFMVLIVIGLARGISNGAESIYWWEDIKPLLYFLVLPFFALVVREEKTVEKAALVIKGSAILLCIAFFIFLFLIHSGILPFLDFYHPALASTEFFFRGELTFFYKGFLYLCIGFIFLHMTAGRHKAVLMTIVMAAIIFTFTRGFLFALALTYAVYFFINGSRLKSLVCVAAAAAIVFFGQSAVGYVSQGIDTINNAGKSSIESPVSVAPKTTLLGDRNFSDSGRKQQLKEVAERITPVSFFIGHGFGNGIPARPVHMEISYLEIFHKQGLPGLIFWIYVLVLLMQKFRAVRNIPAAYPWFFSGLFVFFQSLTNQYVNNPIGLSMVLLAIVSLDVIRSSAPVFQQSTPSEASNQKSAEFISRSF